MLVLEAGGAWCGVPLDAVERVLAAVEVTPLPGAPPHVMGAIDVAGEVVPVFDLAARLGVTQQPIGVLDRLILARVREGRRLALRASSVRSVERFPSQDVVDPALLAPGLEHVAGVTRTGEGLLVIHDVERFLGVEEQAALKRAMARG